jgi:hypothetical protein
MLAVTSTRLKTPTKWTPLVPSLHTAIIYQKEHIRKLSPNGQLYTTGRKMSKVVILIPYHLHI